MHLEQPLRKLVRQIGIEDSRGNRVHADAKGAGLSREAFGKANHRRFGSCVVDGGRQRAHGANRSDVQDLSFALPDHLFVDGLGHCKQAADVRANHFVPRAVGGGGKVVAAIDGGIVDQDIDATPFSDEFPGQMFHAETISDGYFERVRPAAVRFDFLPHFVRQVVARTIIERHVGAFARKHLAQRRADAARAAGYERPLSFE